MSILYLFLGTIFLYLTHRQVTRQFTRLVRHLGGNQNILIWAWSVLFLPGTIVHEISHFLAAAATGTRTGKVEIFPEFLEDILEEEEDGRKSVALGYVQVARMNPLQGFIVGVAPFVSGMAILIWLASLMRTNYFTENYWVLLLQIYLFFVIANSFFPSWSDIKQTLPLIIFSSIGLVLALFFGFQFTLPVSSPLWGVFDTMTSALLLSIVFNLLFIGVLVLINKSLRR